MTQKNMKINLFFVGFFYLIMGVLYAALLHILKIHFMGDCVCIMDTGPYYLLLGDKL